MLYFKPEAAEAAQLQETPFYVKQNVLENAVQWNNSSEAMQQLRALLKSPECWGLRVFEVRRLLDYAAKDMNAYAESHDIGKGFKHICRRHPCPFENDHRGVTVAEAGSPILAPVVPNMHLLVSRHVKPLTRKLGMGYAGAVNASFLARFQGDPEELCKTRVFISHCWNERFEDFVATLTGMLSVFDVVWVCALGIDQNADVTDMLEGSSIEKSPFAQALRSAEKCLVLMDEHAEPPQRVWCVYEAHVALESGKDYSMALADNTNREQWQKVRKVLQGLDVRECAASRLEDKTRILTAIDAESVNKVVQEASATAADAAEVMSAAASGMCPSLEEFIACGRPLDVRDARGRSPLHIAAEYGQDDVAKFLVKHFAESGHGSALHARTSDGLVPIHFAALNGHSSTVHTLREVLPEFSGQFLVSSEGETPLHVAAVMGRVDAIRALLDTSLDPAETEELLHFHDSAGRAPIHRAAGNGHADAVRLLWQSSTSLQIKAGSGDTPLHIAAQRCQLRAVQVLLESRANVHERANDSSSVLHRAAFGGSAEVIKELLAAKALVDALEQEDWTPLHRAAFNGHEAAVAALLEGGADVQAKTLVEEFEDNGLYGIVDSMQAEVRIPEGTNAPHNSRKEPRAVRELTQGARARASQPRLAQQSIPNTTKSRAHGMYPAEVRKKALNRFRSVPCTPGSYMALGRHYGDATDSFDAADEEGDSDEALSLSPVRERRVVVATGARGGWTALHVAAVNGHTAVAEVLLSFRADVACLNMEKETPLQAAIGKGHGEAFAEMLRQNPEQEEEAMAFAHVASASHETSAVIVPLLQQSGTDLTEGVVASSLPSQIGHGKSGCCTVM